MACIISATSPDKPEALSFHLFQCCSNFINPNTICWSFFNSCRYSVFPFIIFLISISMYSFHESVTPFSSTITLPDTPFRQFHPVISCLSFTICFAIRKISLCWTGSFNLLAHSFCFFPFAKEITLFEFSLLFLYSFHASVNFSFFPTFLFGYYSTTQITTNFNQRTTAIGKTLHIYLLHQE